MATIIIVDDSHISRKMLKAILMENGHRVVAEASNGEEGCELFAKHMPDMITLDITMPVLNGIECLKRIKREFPKAKVIMVTALGSEKKKSEAMDEGALGYVLKPFNPDEVAEVVERCLNM